MISVTFINNDAASTGADTVVSTAIELVESTSVSDLKSNIQAQLGIPAQRQVFIRDGLELDTSAQTVGQLGLRNNDTIFVVQTPERSHGGAVTAMNPGMQVAVNGMQPMYRRGMHIDEAMALNKDPRQLVQVLKHDGRLKHDFLAYYSKAFKDDNPDMELKDVLEQDFASSVDMLKKFLMKLAMKQKIKQMTEKAQLQKMKDRLAKDPSDEEAKKYIEKADSKDMINYQYMQTMEDYPETMTRVLMLYIDCKVNNIHVQAFVDSGAQTSVMSLRCVKKLGLDHLIDERFSSQMVGVGSSKTKGKIHIALLNIKENVFPISVTVLDDNGGFGDKNMDFLLGLDMLKRHSCNIDLAKGVLRFIGHDGSNVEAEFLHEKDLEQTKGGTKGFVPDKE